MIKVHRCIVLCPALAFILTACSPASRETYRIAVVPARTGQHGIFVMNSDTTGGRLLTPDPTAQLRASSWSPDGSKIAFFATRREDSEILLKYRMPLHFPLYSMDAAGGNQRRLLDFPVARFEWSPDSRQLLYVSAYQDPAHDDPDVLKGKRTPMSAVYLLDLRSGRQRRVTGFGQNCYGSWSPDGRYVALSFGNEQSSEIYIAGLDGRHTRRIGDSEGINVKPAWSPDGKRIAYISSNYESEGGMWVACTINADGAAKKRIGDVAAHEVSWSPDGKSLLLQSAGGISLAFADGSRTVSLTSGTVQPRDAVFTPDGKKAMFRSNHEGEWHLYTVDLNGANLRRITGKLSASTFSLSPLKR